MENSTKPNDNKLNKEIVTLLINPRKKSTISILKENNT